MPLRSESVASVPPDPATGERGPVEPPRPRTVGAATVTDVKVSDAGATVGEVRTLFLDEHVHSAVVVDGGVLLTVIDRVDVTADHADDELAVHLGIRGERVVGPDVDLDHAHRLLLGQGRRRLAVATQDGTFIGLLCLKRTLGGFCSDRDAAARRRAVRIA